jgi:tetratricopeptide (TPR) repeat protein
MNGNRIPTTRLLFLWICALILSAAYFIGLYRIAPAILIREGRANHSDLYALADKNYRRVRELRWVLPAEEKNRLLDEAIDALEEATKQRPESRDYRWYLGSTLYLRAHQLDPPDSTLIARALEEVTSLWESTGRDWEKPGAFLADHYAKYGDREQAISILEHLLMVHPGSGDTYSALLDLYLAQNRKEEAVKLLLLKEQKTSLSMSDLDRLSLLFFERGDFSAAIDTLNRLVSGGAGDTRRLFLLAAAHRGIADFDAAFRILRETLNGLRFGTKFPSAQSYSLPRFPEGVFPTLAYLLLERRLGTPSASP